jgi:hypothetical protein
MVVMCVVTAVLLQHSAMDTESDCSFVGRLEGKWWLCVSLLQYCYITVL